MEEIRSWSRIMVCEGQLPIYGTLYAVDEYFLSPFMSASLISFLSAMLQ